jgi:hypothetical protein
MIMARVSQNRETEIDAAYLAIEKIGRLNDGAALSLDLQDGTTPVVNSKLVDPGSGIRRSLSDKRSGFNALIEKITLRQQNFQTPTAASQSPQCIIATAAYGSEVAPPSGCCRQFAFRKVVR